MAGVTRDAAPRPVLARMPADVVDAIDRAAAKNCMEIRRRVTESPVADGELPATALITEKGDGYVAR